MIDLQTIKDIFKDILKDKEIYRRREEDFSDFQEKKDFLKQYHPLGYKKGRNTGIFPLILPQILGIILGLALARLFRCGFSGYVILGILCSLVLGTWKNYEYDRMMLKYAILRNIIIAVPVDVFLAVCLVFPIYVISK